MTSIKRLLYLFFLYIFLSPLSVQAQSTLTGSLKNYNAFQTTGNYELLAGRNSLRFQFNSFPDFGSIYIEPEITHIYTDSDQLFEWFLREAYFDLFFESSDLRIGKQNIVWGLAAGAFVTDILSPTDIREFLTRDVDELRTGLTSLNLTRYFQNNYIQFILAPTFQPDQLPEPNTRWFPVQEIPSALPFFYVKDSRMASVRDIQLATRYAYRSNPSFDLDLMLYYWTHPAPVYGVQIPLPDFINGFRVNLIETYKPSPIAGTAFEWRPGGGWAITTEALYVHQKLFTFLPVSVSRLEQALEDPAEALLVLQEFQPRDDNYVTNKPWLNSMLSFRYERGNWVAGTQAFLEVIFNYDEKILSQQFFPYATLFAQRTFLRDKLTASAITRYNFYAEDYWVQLQGTYEVRDGLEVSAGSNLFAGPDFSPFYGHFTFSLFRENSFVFTRIKAYF
jgi:hypothetical protein